MELPKTVSDFASRHHINVVHVEDATGGHYEVLDSTTGKTAEMTRTMNPTVRHALAMCRRYLRATRQWVIYRQNTRTFEMEAFRPTLDGKPRIFVTKGEARDYAYDYQIAGQRNSFVEYREEPRDTSL